MTCSEITVIRVIIYVICTIGFVLQSHLIATDYFSYKTTSLVSVLSFPEKIAIPTVAVCDDNDTDTVFHKTLREVFQNMPLGNVTVLTTHIRYDCATLYDGYYANLQQFYKNYYYCLTFSPLDSYKHITRKDDIIPCPGYPIFKFRFNTTRPGVAKINLIPSNGDFDVPTRVPILSYVQDYTWLDFWISYSMTVRKLAFPPYDTQCMNYTRHGFTSQDNCVSSCIKSIITKHNFLINQIAIKKNEYENSSMPLLPFFYRLLRIDNMKINNDSYLLDSLPQWYVSRAKKGNVTIFLQEQREAIKAHALCKQSCHQPDCYTEMLTPALLQQSKGGDWKAEGYNNRTKFSITLYQPNQPVITVESKPKLDIIDLLVYLSSCLSFWFGFCPFNLPEVIDEKLKYFRKRRQINNYPVTMDTLLHFKTQISLKVERNLKKQVDNHRSQMSQLHIQLQTEIDRMKNNIRDLHSKLDFLD